MKYKNPLTLNCPMLAYIFNILLLYNNVNHLFFASLQHAAHLSFNNVCNVINLLLFPQIF